MSGRTRPTVACVEDADESGNIFEESRRYATSVAPSSPIKERPNTGRVRREKNRRSDSSPLTSTLNTDSDTTVHPRRDALKKSSSQRDKSVGASKKTLQMASRPTIKPTKTAPAYPKRDDAAYYGVDPATITPASSNSRPRAKSVRPNSYYGAPGSKPPSANAKFYQSKTPGPQMSPFGSRAARSSRLAVLRCSALTEPRSTFPRTAPLPSEVAATSQATLTTTMIAGLAWICRWGEHVECREQDHTRGLILSSINTKAKTMSMLAPNTLQQRFHPLTQHIQDIPRRTHARTRGFTDILHGNCTHFLDGKYLIGLTTGRPS